jgi:hypothetical protein
MFCYLYRICKYKSRYRKVKELNVKANLTFTASILSRAKYAIFDTITIIFPAIGRLPMEWGRMTPDNPHFEWDEETQQLVTGAKRRLSVSKLILCIKSPAVFKSMIAYSLMKLVSTSPTCSSPKLAKNTGGGDR